ncbi:hypothetical protein BJ165DRAFT_175758 [Panaeolus papilionaceus]|nr:hypothetical protein BJ165DRAFT_175758 [Panaeolus papilionaceus]
MTALILSLSDDLIIEVLCLLHYQCLIKVSETCRRLYRIIRTCSSLQLVVELGKDGLTCLRRDLHSKDMLDALEEWRRRWDTLDWEPASISTYTGPFPVSDGIYESGIFVSLQRYSNATRIAWLDMADFAHRSVNLSHPTQPTCYSMDPGQSLLVSVELRGVGPIGVAFWDNTTWEPYLHFTNLTTAGAHPDARLRSVKLDVPAFDRDAMNDIVQRNLMDTGIVDRAVVWRVRHRGPQGSYSQVVIYNWQLGVCVYNSGQEFSEQQFDEFQLISDTVYVVTTKDRSDRGELLVYTFSITPDSDVQYTYIGYEHSSPRKSWHVDNIFTCASDEQLLLLRICL